jgi:choline-sulfatase
LPSTAALLSAEHPVRIFTRGSKLTSSLVEEIKRAGITTAAFTEGGYVASHFRMDLGFGVWVEEEGAVRASAVTPETGTGAGGIENTFRLAREWLREHHDERFFIFIHTYEAHTPYSRHAFTGMMNQGRIGSDLTIEKLAQIESGELVLTDVEVNYLKALYDGGIYEVDRHVGSFLELLSSLGIEQSTLVVVTSDHGEELNDHYRAHTAGRASTLRLGRGSPGTA